MTRQKLTKANLSWVKTHAVPLRGNNYDGIQHKAHIIQSHFDERQLVP